MITSSTTVVNTAPIMGLNQFEAILKAAGSPAASEAKQIYQTVVKNKIEPAFFLAVAWKESQFATDPKSMVVIHKTKNLGNTRSSRIGVTNIVPTERGNFVSYDTWAQGADDATFRLIDTNFGYAKAGAKTIGEIIPIWAPGSDGNDPAGYVKTVVKLMSKWIGEGSKMQDPTTRTRLIPGHAGRGRGGGNPLIMTMHVQQGQNDLYPEFLNRPDSNAADCTIWSKQDGTLDRLLLDTDTPWTNGDIVAPDMSNPIIAGLVKKGVTNSNRYALTIEHQGFAESGFSDAQLEGTAKMIAYWCSLYGWTPSRTNVIGHYQIGNHKNCPGPLFPFDRVIARAKELLGGSVVAAPDNSTVKINNHMLGGGFKLFYDRLAAIDSNFELLTLGLPATDEFDCPLDGKTNTIQLFERGGLIYESANIQPWDIHMLTTGQLVQALAVAKERALLN